MSKHTMDAIKVARMIQQDNLSSLSRKSFVIVDNHDKIKKKPGRKMKKKNKYSLNQLGTKVDQLSTTVDKLTAKVDQIADDLKELTKLVNKGFKHVNARIDRIEARLDYNNLKKLPETIPNK